MVDRAEIAAVMLSPDLLMDTEAEDCQRRLFERRNRGEIRLVPILVRPVDLSGTPYKEMRCLPGDERPLSVRTTSIRQEEVLMEITMELRRLAESLPPVPTTDSERRRPPSGTSPEFRHLLFKDLLHGGGTVSIVGKVNPWDLPVDAMVVPAGSQANLSGSLASAYFAEFGGEDEISRRVKDALRAREQGILTPERPLLLPSVNPDRGPRFLILATAFDEMEVPSPEHAAEAAGAVVRLAHEKDIASLVMPMLGSGAGRADPVAVAQAMAKAVIEEIQKSPITEVILSTMSSRTMEALIKSRVGQVRPLSEPFPAPLTPTPELSEETPAPPPPPPPKPRGTDLRLHIVGGERALYDGDNRIWERRDASVAWLAPFRIHDEDVTLKTVRRDLSRSWREPEVKALGRQLAARLFGVDEVPAEVLTALELPNGVARRFLLDVEGPASALPWEYLYLKDSFLLERRLSVVRHVDVARPYPIRLTLPPDTLCLAALATAGGPDYKPNARSADLHAALRRAGLKDRMLPFAQVAQIGEALQDKTVGVFHFLGHGKDGYLCLHDHAKPDAVDPLTGPQLRQLVGQSGSVRFMFLCACYSGGAAGEDDAESVAEFVARNTGIPVVAMQLEVDAEYANDFAGSFYEGLRAVDFDVERAVYESRNFTRSGRSSFGTPVLFADFVSEPQPHPALPPPPQPAFAPLVVLAPKADWKPHLDRLPADLRPAVEAALDSATRDVPPPPEPRADQTALLRAVRELLLDQGQEVRAGQVDHRIVREEERCRAQVAFTGGSAFAAPGVELDEPLRLPALSHLSEGPFKALHEQYSFPQRLVRRVLAELDAGRHILLTGPVGTGKTTLALKVIEALGYQARVATASADWTNHDVIGSYWPIPAGGAVEFAFRHGPALEAIMANWQVDWPDGAEAPRWLRAAQPGARGVWLLIDEFNRADMDRALGGLFTALETRRLSVPAARYVPGTSVSQVVPIPEDFRIICTLNTADRHYLFPMSDALKRRFAFIDVPVTEAWAEEWQRLAHGDDEAAPADDLRRFVYLARLFRPVGSAQLLAARRSLAAGARAGLDETERLVYALSSSVLPTLEDIEEPLQDLLLGWTQSGGAKELGDKIAATMESLPAAKTQYLQRQLESLRQSALVAEPPMAVLDAGAAAELLVRQQVTGPLPALAEHIGRLRTDVA